MNCPLCSESKVRYLFIVRGLPIIQCAGCGLVSAGADPRFLDCWPFQRDAGCSDHGAFLQTDTATEREACRRYLNELHARGLSQGRLLLVAAPGHIFAAEAARQGFEIGLHTSGQDVVDGVLPENSFDACVILHETEKCTDPLLLLTRIHAALRPGAPLLLTTPHVDSWPCGFLGHQWTEWRPDNRFYFSKRTMQLLLLKAGFGQLLAEADKRLYTLAHVKDRATALPRTALTRLIGGLSRLLPGKLGALRIRLASSGLIVSARRRELRQKPVCSIIVPAYNEARTFTTLMDALLARELAGVEKEIIVVESHSSDGTRELAAAYRNRPEVRLIFQDKPRGKGNAVREGLRHATGDVVVIQDADLEYDLNDYDTLLEPLLDFRAQYVLGSRHGGVLRMRRFRNQAGLAAFMNLGHVFFTTLINLLYNESMKDPFTMFKVFHRDCLYGLDFRCNHFDFDHELVIKLARKGYSPLEIPVNYCSRSYAEGKKVNIWREPLRWLWVDLILRLKPLTLRPAAEEQHVMTGSGNAEPTFRDGAVYARN